MRGISINDLFTQEFDRFRKIIYIRLDFNKIATSMFLWSVCELCVTSDLERLFYAAFVSSTPADRHNEIVMW